MKIPGSQKNISRPFFYLFLTLTIFIFGLAYIFINQANSRPKVALLPLDSRPVNTDLPQQLAAIGGITVNLPEVDMLDQFLTPSHQEELFNWLEEQYTEVDMLVIHLNELLFGGLINSREVSQYDLSATKLAKLENFLIDNNSSDKQIQLLYIMPRLLVSQYDLVMWEYEKELTNYSQLKHQLAIEPNNSSLIIELAKLEKQIPLAIKERYVHLYKQAFSVGQELLNWAEQSLVDEVIIGLDDAAPFGLNVLAYEKLQEETSNRQLQQIHFLHGADELAPLVIAANSLNLQDKNTFSTMFLCPEDANTIFAYEAISLQQNIEEKLTYLYTPRPLQKGKRIWQASQGKAAELKYLVINSSQATATTEMEQAWQQIEALPSYTGLVDAAKTNGSFTPFIDTIGLEQVYDYVDAYAGWNTAGNSLGTVMAHLIFYESSKDLIGPSKTKALQANQHLQRVRLLDDYIFQSQVRADFIQWSLAEGYNYLSFEQQWPQANTKLTELMNKAIADYPKLWLNPQNTYDFSFPWPRSFELRIQEKD